MGGGLWTRHISAWASCCPCSYMFVGGLVSCRRLRSAQPVLPRLNLILPVAREVFYIDVSRPSDRVTYDQSPHELQVARADSKHSERCLVSRVPSSQAAHDYGTHVDSPALASKFFDDRRVLFDLANSGSLEGVVSVLESNRHVSNRHLFLDIVNYDDVRPHTGGGSGHPLVLADPSSYLWDGRRYTVDNSVMPP